MRRKNGRTLYDYRQIEAKFRRYYFVMSYLKQEIWDAKKTMWRSSSAFIDLRLKIFTSESGPDL